MGTYVNPTNDGFASIVRSEYIDKTGLIGLVNDVVDSARKLICVSRPRRFGKSFAAASLVAYYGWGNDSHRLFEGLDISRRPDFERHLNAYNLIRLDLTEFAIDADADADIVPALTTTLANELRDEFPDVSQSDKLTSTILDVVRATGRKFVFVIDEWDVPLREALRDARTRERYVGWLRLLFKNASFTDEAVAAAYLTGILPIVKYDTQSALSDFWEYSMIRPGPFAPYAGFTENEVRALCERHDSDFAEMRRWYDGYDLPGTGSVYSPFSVMQALAFGSFGSYWVSTSAYDSLLAYIERDFDGLQTTIGDLIAGERVGVNALAFRNDLASVHTADDVLIVLVHLGYLAYDERSRTVRVPNEEVRGEFMTAIRGGTSSVLTRMVTDADQLLADTVAGNEEAVAAAVEHAHDSRVGPDWYNDEQALRFAVKLAYLTAVDAFAEIEELPNGSAPLST